MIFLAARVWGLGYSGGSWKPITPVISLLIPYLGDLGALFSTAALN